MLLRMRARTALATLIVNGGARSHAFGVADKQLANGWLQVWDAIHHAHFYVNDSAGTLCHR